MFSKEEVANAKERYIKLLRSTERTNIDELIDYLSEHDFFEAPSSSRYHSAFKHGLLFHSLNVYDSLVKIYDALKDNLKNAIKPDSLVIAALLHDICKVDFYATEKRNKKIDGLWQEVEIYTIKDTFPAGHGEKSVMLAQRYIKLTKAEMLAIDWHMGGFDIRCGDYQGKTAISNAMEMVPLVSLLQMADVNATYLMETRDD